MSVICVCVCVRAGVGVYVCLCLARSHTFSVALFEREKVGGLHSHRVSVWHSHAHEMSFVLHNESVVVPSVRSRERERERGCVCVC